MTTVPRTVRIDLSYHGGRFHGSQRQEGVRTVQGDLEDAISQVTGCQPSLAFAGRTDRGVHAVGQVASGRVFWGEELERFRFGLDSVTASDLSVRAVTDVDSEFHARYSAKRREYRYRVWISRRAPVLIADAVWWMRDELDVERMNCAALSIVGRHDFRSFTGKGYGTRESSRKTLRTVDMSEWREIASEWEPGGQVVEYRIRADSFLPHMVRNIVGAMIEIGTGTREDDWMESLIAKRDRRTAPPPAPPHGLVLWNVEY